MNTRSWMAGGLITLFTTLLISNAFAEGGSSTVGFPNPAGVYCKDLGGKSKTVTTPPGESALCVFGENASIDQWTLYRNNHDKRAQAVQALFKKKTPPPPHQGPIGMANPASVECIKQGGKGVNAKLKDGGSVGLCEFPDRSIIEQWTLYRGSASAENAELMKVLK